MKPLTDRELYKLFNEHLDDAYGIARIAGHEYQASSALKAVDPIAYSCGFTDWLDAELSDGRLFEKDDEYYLEDPTGEEK